MAYFDGVKPPCLDRVARVDVDPHEPIEGHPE